VAGPAAVVALAAEAMVEATGRVARLSFLATSLKAER
jgi:hypothetical protein